MRGLIYFILAWGCLAAATAQAHTLLPAGALSTQGNQIVDKSGRPVRLACIGWNQFNQAIPLRVQTQRMANDGFNCIRIPWVNATLPHELLLMDRIVAAAGGARLGVIFDNHTNEPGHGDRDNWGAQQKNGLWFDRGPGTDNTDGGGNPGTTTDAKFLSDWQTMARHYAGVKTVIGYDLRNEPLSYPGMSEWATGSVRDIRAMYMRVGGAIQKIDPDKLIIVEPPEGAWAKLKTHPVDLPVAHKLVYSPHEYPAEISDEKPDSGSALLNRMNKRWGWLISEGIAPVFVGEMGSSMRSRESHAWADTIVPYLNGKGLHIQDGGQGVSTDWWVWGYLPGQNPDGTLESDWKTPRPEQLAVYARLRPWSHPEE